jgi:hypothetical protein
MVVLPSCSLAEVGGKTKSPQGPQAPSRVAVVQRSAEWWRGEHGSELGFDGVHAFTNEIGARLADIYRASSMNSEAT